MADIEIDNAHFLCVTLVRYNFHSRSIFQRTPALWRQHHSFLITIILTVSSLGLTFSFHSYIHKLCLLLWRLSLSWNRLSHLGVDFNVYPGKSSVFLPFLLPTKHILHNDSLLYCTNTIRFIDHLDIKTIFTKLLTYRVSHCFNIRVTILINKNWPKHDWKYQCILSLFSQSLTKL